MRRASDAQAVRSSSQNVDWSLTAETSLKVLQGGQLGFM